MMLETHMKLCVTDAGLEKYAKKGQKTGFFNI